MTKSITSKLIVLLTVCLTAILSAGMAIDYQLSREQILARLQLESTDTITGVVTDLENWLDGVEGSTLFLGRILEQREYSLPGLEQMLRDIVEKNDDVYGATIALDPAQVDDPRGFAPYYFHKDGVLTYANLAEGVDRYWQRAWFTDAVAAGKPVWVEPYFDHGGGEVLMTTFSVPIFRSDAAGSYFLYGVVTADVALDELHQYLQRLRLGKSGFGILLSRQGIILSSKNPDAIMQHHLEAAENALDAEAWKEIFAGAVGGRVMSHQLECPQILGTCMIRLSALESTGWPVGVIYSEDEMLAPLRAFQIRTALLGLATLLVMALVISLISRRLTQPLTALAQVTDQIAQGKFNVPLPRVQGEDEVARLIRAFAAMKKNLRTYIDDLEAATAARSRHDGELAAAKEIQMAMLPQGGEALEKMTAYSLWATVRPAKTVGGDLYTYYNTSGDQLFIAVGDVSDKGVPAALFMAKTISHIQQYSEAFIEPARGMALLNNALESGNSNCMFVTLFFGVLDLPSGELRFSSAGHTPPSLVRDGASGPITQESGAALGLAADLEFPENRVQLRAGDRLAIYTDGIDEAFNENAEMFTCERLDRELERHRDEGITDAGNSIIAAIDKFAGTMPQSDDISLMLIDLHDKGPAKLASRTLQGFSQGPLLASRVDDWVRRELRKHTENEAIIMELTLVSEEIVTNIDKYSKLSADSEIEISIEVEASEIRLEFSDRGIAFNPLEQAQGAVLGADIESAEIGGLGVHLITELTDTQQYHRREGRNILRITKAMS